jgi:bifunctional DNA-binding transcriptional regulator/antitoxin component of YhaV-PrlF toxin-antitoxin module
VIDKQNRTAYKTNITSIYCKEYMQRFIASVTQRGQVTLPKRLREQYGITPLSKIVIAADDLGIRIEPTQDITDLAGAFIPDESKPVLSAREEMENTYRRV